jgi:hypothetical protein
MSLLLRWTFSWIETSWMKTCECVCHFLGWHVCLAWKSLGWNVFIFVTFWDCISWMKPLGMRSRDFVPCSGMTFSLMKIFLDENVLMCLSLLGWHFSPAWKSLGWKCLNLSLLLGWYFFGWKIPRWKWLDMCQLLGLHLLAEIFWMKNSWCGHFLGLHFWMKIS